MGSKQVQVGGGPSTGLANSFVSTLQNGMQQGFGPNTQNGGVGFNGAMSDALGGNLGGNKTFGTDAVNSLGTLAGNVKPFDFGTFNPQGANYAGFQNPLQGFQAANPNIAAPNSGLDNSTMQGFLSKLMNFGGTDPTATAKQFGFNPANVPGAAPNAALNPNAINLTPYQAMADRQRAQTLADTRARFGASGGAAFGTPAAMAEANAMSAFDANNLATMAGIGQSQQQLDLNAQQGNQNSYNQWLNNFVSGQTAGNGTAGGVFTGLNNSLVNALTGGGQLTGDQLNNFNNNSMTAGVNNANNALTGSGQNLSALTNMGNLNLGVLNGMSQQGQGMQGLLNQFLGMKSGDQLGNNQLLNSIFGNQGGMDLQGQGLGLDWGKFQGGAELQGLQSLLGSLGQMSLPGIPQAQMVNKPGFLQNLMGGLTSLAGAAAPFIPGAGLALRGLKMAAPSGGLSMTNSYEQPISMPSWNPQAALAGLAGH